MDRIVFFQGAFDLLNVGHIRCFKKAKSLGKYLIVALNTDELIRRYKHREPVMPYKERKVILKGNRYIDRVVPINTFSCLKLLKTLKVDIYIQSREWEDTHQKEINYMKAKGGKAVFLPRSKNILSSSEIRKKCNSKKYQK